MAKKEMTPIERLKAAAMNKEISDKQVAKLLLDTDVVSLAEISEAVDILEKYRPEVLTALNSSISRHKSCSGCRDCSCGKKRPQPPADPD